LANRTRGLVHHAPWRTVALCYLRGQPKAHPSAPSTLAEFYRLLGWTEQQAYQRRRFSSHMQLRIVAQMASALRAPLGEFLEQVALEEGVPPVNQRVIHKPRAQQKALYKLGLACVTCHRCGGRGHGSRSKKCPMWGVPKSSLEVMKAQARAKPTPRRKPRKRREP
jgi:hypothetical protein